jgi:hypothetical protein
MKIANKISRISQGWATDKAAAVVMIQDCDPAVLALITAKCVLDVLGLKGRDCLCYPVSFSTDWDNDSRSAND